MFCLNIPCYFEVPTEDAAHPSVNLKMNPSRKIQSTVKLTFYIKE